MQIMELPKSRREKLDELEKGECIVISLEERQKYSTEITRSFYKKPDNTKVFTIRTDRQKSITGVWRLA